MRPFKYVFHQNSPKIYACKSLEHLLLLAWSIYLKWQTILKLTWFREPISKINKFLIPVSKHSIIFNLGYLLKTVFWLCYRYYVAVMDVLTSVQKTEDSLRRFKKFRDRSIATGSTPDRGGDDDKIRMQLYFDANYFCTKVLINNTINFSYLVIKVSP